MVLRIQTLTSWWDPSDDPRTNLGRAEPYLTGQSLYPIIRATEHFKTRLSLDYQYENVTRSQWSKNVVGHRPILYSITTLARR